LVVISEKEEQEEEEEEEEEGLKTFASGKPILEIYLCWVAQC